MGRVKSLLLDIDGSTDMDDYCAWMEAHGEVPPLDYLTTLVAAGKIIEDNPLDEEDI
jgi:hypothetical protein